MPRAAPVIEDDEIQEVVKTMKSGWPHGLIQNNGAILKNGGTGPKVAQFEKDVHKFEEKSYISVENTVLLHQEV